MDKPSTVNTSPPPYKASSLDLSDGLMHSYVINNRILFDPLTDTLRLLSDDSNLIKLAPIITRGLVVFCLRPKTVLRRDFLMDIIWMAHGFVVTENSLNQTVSRIREHLSSLDPDHTYIKTVPRIGYYFAGSIETA